ncbi:cytochrome P450 [Absidia repens]|uniref:Cytochrome P450 n=1 Tax=Absidia repens TaxID=90262 RepID=A0A1X2IEY8_9FUNG|nr:cytochrome P450 [Absidia repens]
MNTLQFIRETGIEQFYHQWIQPRLRDKKAIGIAVAIALLYSLHRKITKPPANLRHLPWLGFYKYHKAILSNVTVDQFSRDITLPVMEKSSGAFLQPMVGYWIIQLTDPIAIKQLLQKIDIFPKSKINQGDDGSLMYRFIGGDNILMLNGDDWKRHRKIANPAFTRAMPVKLFGELTTTMFKAMDGLGKKIDVLDLFSRVTIDTIGKAGFGFDFNALTNRNSEWVENYDNVKEGMLDPFFLVFPTCDTTLLKWFPKRQKVHDQLTHFLEMLAGIIEDRRKTMKEARENGTEQLVEAHERDLLTLMIECEENENATLSNEELRRNLCIFFLAGHDTTAFTLSFMIYELAVNPEMQERARKEAIAILGDDPYDKLPDIEDTKQMSYINAVMKETMRLHNPVLSTTAREATKDCVLNGIFIPKGSLVSADILDVHRNPKVWTSPYEFNPDRFLPGGEAEQKTSAGTAWIPFSSGGRICVGMNFSLVEQRVILSMLLRKYKWKLPSDSIHANGLKTHGVAFGIISSTNLDIDFEKRY